MNACDQIYMEICKAAGYTQDALGRELIDDVQTYLLFEVKQMYDRSLKWRSTPSGRYQINVTSPYGDRPKIFRTKVKDGSYDIDGVVEAIRLTATARKAQQAREQVREANRSEAERVRDAYKLKSYVSTYASAANSFCAAASTEGMLQVQINFGTVTPEMAEKILAFAQSIGA